MIPTRGNDLFVLLPFQQNKARCWVPPFNTQCVEYRQKMEKGMPFWTYCLYNKNTIFLYRLASSSRFCPLGFSKEILNNLQSPQHIPKHIVFFLTFSYELSYPFYFIRHGFPRLLYQCSLILYKSTKKLFGKFQVFGFNDLCFAFFLSSSLDISVKLIVLFVSSYIPHTAGFAEGTWESGNLMLIHSALY